MIAADTSSLIAFLSGEEGEDVRLIQQAMTSEELRLPPPVVSELLSGAEDTDQVRYLLATVALLPIIDGFWERAGLGRRTVLAQGRKARLADAMVAQCCIDSDVPLIVRDRDFRHFVEWCGLKLAE